MSHAVAITNVFREDTPSRPDPAQALQNAPDEDRDCFRVPRVIE